MGLVICCLIIGFAAGVVATVSFAEWMAHGDIEQPITPPNNQGTGYADHGHDGVGSEML